jgi:hypothetical protein
VLTGALSGDQFHGFGGPLRLSARSHIDRM